MFQINLLALLSWQQLSFYYRAPVRFITPRLNSSVRADFVAPCAPKNSLFGAAALGLLFGGFFSSFGPLPGSNTSAVRLRSGDVPEWASRVMGTAVLRIMGFR